MQTHRFHVAIMMIAVAALLATPIILQAAEGQRPVKPESQRRGMISGLHGTVQATSPDATARSLRFHDPVNAGETITTGEDSLVEMLLGRRTLITARENSTLQLVEDAPGQTIVKLSAGDVRIAVARADETVIIRTPSATAVTRGGLVRITLSANRRQAGSDIRDGRAHAVPTAFVYTMPVAEAPGPSEAFQAYEGTLQVKPTISGAGSVTLDSGQGIQMSGGQMGRPFPLTSTQEEGLPLAAVEPHTRTSEAGIQYLAARQKQQALTLQQALLGRSDIGRPYPGDAASIAIIPTTGATQSQQLQEQIQQQADLSLLFGPGSIFNGAMLTATARTATGIADDKDSIAVLLNSGTSNGKTFTVQGGGGLVTFNNHVIQSNSELFIVDSGARQQAPHGGVPPSTPLFVTPSPLLPAPTMGGPRSVIGLELQIPGAESSGGGTQSQNINNNAEVFIGSGGSVANVNLQQYSRENSNISGGLSGQNTFNSNLVVRTVVNGQGAFTRFANPELTQLPSNERERSIVDGIIRARSEGSGAVTLSGGVILNNATLIAAFDQPPPTDPALPAALQPPVNATHQYFTVDTRQSEVVNGSIAGIIAKKDSNGTLQPALAAVQDRVLAVLNGSSIMPDNASTKISLLSVLDGQLVGPTSIPSSRTGQGGQSPGVPPLIEVIGGNTSPSQVQATSAVVIRSTGALNGILPADRGLLEASSPLIAMVHGTMATSSHFADLSGTAPVNSKGLLVANLIPGDALVRLDASQLTVGGNLFNLTNGASASVTGHLFSLANNSTLTVNGALVSLTGNSTFNLTSTAFGVFGPGTNTLNINNNLCAGGCTAISGFPALQVSGGGTVTLPSGFVPFATASGATPIVHIQPGAAVFNVTPGSTLNVTVRH